MEKSLLRFLMAGSLAFGVFAASADDAELFDDRYYVAPMGSLTGNRGNPTYGDGLGGALAIGKSLAPHFGLELLGDYLHYRGKTVTTRTTGLLCGVLTQCPDQVSQVPGQRVYGGGLGVNYYLSPSNAGLFVHANAEGGDRFMYNAGLGFDQAFFNRAVYLRLEALYHKETSYGAEPLVHLGLRVPFGSVREPEQPAPPPPVAVVPVEQPAPAVEAAPPSPSPATCQPPAPGQPISLEGCKAGDTIVLHGVNFEFDKATLTVNAKTLLDQVADALLARKDIKVEIDGHTDGKGSVPYNQKLSEARAASVMKYLNARGVEPGRMSSKGFGRSMPIADNSTEEGRELNRRVELKVTESALPVGQTSEGQPAPAAADNAPPPSGEVPAVPAAEAAPAPKKKHLARHRKQAAPAEAAPSAAAPAEPAAPEQSAPAPAPAEPAKPEQSAPAPAPQEAAPAPAPTPAPAEQSAAPPAAPAAAPSGDAASPTEPAPAPPAPAAAPQEEAAPAPLEPAAPQQSAPPAAAPSGDDSPRIEPAPAPPGSAPQAQQ